MILGKRKNIIGLDVGSSSIKLIELVEGKNGYKLQNLGMSPLPPEAIVDGALMDSVTIIDTIRDLVAASLLPEAQSLWAVAALPLRDVAL